MQGASSMITMELMRHSERKLTDKLSTRTPIYFQREKWFATLPDEENLIEILTEISGKTGLNGSKSVEIGSVKTEPKNRLEPASLQGLSTQKGL